METIYLQKKHGRRFTQGSYWVFSNELQPVSKEIQPGDIVRLCDFQNSFLGIGFYHPKSLIAFRFLSPHETKIDECFFYEKIKSSFNHRLTFYNKDQTNAFRVCFGESDGLSGLIIDKFDDCFSIQTFCIGMERALPLIIDAVATLFLPKSIILKNKSPLRLLENMTLYDKVAYGTEQERVLIYISGINYIVDMMHGHKTGFFLDHRENRKAMLPFFAKKDVLDVFCGDGGFSLTAAFGGAKSVTAIDSTEMSLKRLKANAELNGFTSINPICDDAFDFLTKMKKQNKKFDVVILDPPSFTKSKKNIAQAEQAYIRLNQLGFSILNDTGILMTASCSHHISEDHFLSIIKKAATLEKKFGLKYLFKSAQPPDHPALVFMPETSYLKFFAFLI